MAKTKFTQKNASNDMETKKNNRAVAWDKSASKPRLGWYSEITDTLAGDHQLHKHTRTIIGLGKRGKKNQKKTSLKKISEKGIEPAYIPIRETSLRKSECTHMHLCTQLHSARTTHHAQNSDMLEVRPRAKT